MQSLFCDYADIKQMDIRTGTRKSCKVTQGRSFRLILQMDQDFHVQVECHVYIHTLYLKHVFLSWMVNLAWLAHVLWPSISRVNNRWSCFHRSIWHVAAVEFKTLMTFFTLIMYIISLWYVCVCDYLSSPLMYAAGSVQVPPVSTLFSYHSVIRLTHASGYFS